MKSIYIITKPFVECFLEDAVIFSYLRSIIAFVIIDNSFQPEANILRYLKYTR